MTQRAAAGYVTNCEARLVDGPTYDAGSWLRLSSTLLEPGVEAVTTWVGGPGGVNTVYARCVDPVTDEVTDEIGPIRMGSGAGPSVDALTIFGS
ncbi:hypothetical protein ACFYVR_22060 [Rhodococcus sp. NPDC003318]|uniref:hypothetical protein n=1 Tax=Rhodococcus sp. NPDC003318 TaxID=3364503 RepID=UPI0036A41247